MGAPLSDILFSPFVSPKLSLPGRVMMAPMTRLRCESGVPDDSVKDFYLRRATSGVSFIMSEGITVDHRAASPSINAPSLSTATQREGWSNLLKSIHSAGAKMGCQLWHSGTIRKPDESPHPTIPNFIVFAREGSVERAATDEDIQDVADAFVRTAKFAIEVGFDALEIHCAHGYLLDLFLWDQVNKRTDSWGGSTPLQRSRFPLEVVRQVRSAVGNDVPIFARFSQWKQQDFEARLWRNPAELEAVMGAFEASGVDIFDFSLRRFWEPEFEGSDLNLAGWVKKLVGKPTVAVGSVGLTGDFMTAFLNEGAEVATINDLRRRLERSEFDLIAVGRALMNDPLWLSKIREDRHMELKPMPENAMDIYW